MNGEALNQPVGELRDIQGYQAIMVPNYLWWILIVLALVFVAYAIYRFVQSRKSEVVLTIFEQAVQDLDALDLNQDSKEFYLLYSDIVRGYLLERVDLNLFDKTLNELRTLFDKDEVFDMQSKNQLLNIFAKADMAKFAKRDVSAEKRLDHLDKTKNILSKLEERLEQEAKQSQAMAGVEEAIKGVEAL